MKKFAAGLSILLLSSCLQAGDYSILPQRNSFFEAWDSYPIDYYDTDLQLVKSEYITEREFEPNKILSAYVGYSVADLKTYRKDFFKAEYVRPAMDGVLNSASIPVAYTKKEKLQVIGEVTIDGERYMLLPTKQDKAAGKETSMPSVLAAASVMIVMVMAAPSMLIVAPSGIETE